MSTGTTFREQQVDPTADAAKGESVETVAFHIVDVFAQAALTGNPLAIVPSADELSDGVMQKIARELGQAETTFLLNPTAMADVRLRSFTAGGVEVFGAGHNSLGAWWWMLESGYLPLTGPHTPFTQEIGGQLLPVRYKKCEGRLDSVTLMQSHPVFGSVCHDQAALADALGLTVDDFASFHVQSVSTGTPHLLVPVRSRARVEAVRPNASQLVKVLTAVGAQGCYLFSLDPVSSKATAHARFFNPAVGLFEDSATGSAAGPLACQLVALGFIPDDTSIDIEQGIEMGRPSLLRVHVCGNSVQLTGRCLNVAHGTLRIQ